MPPPQCLIPRLGPHFAHPSGLIGRLVGKFMSRSNRRMNAFTVDALALHPTDRVLEIGFGGGLNLVPLVEHVAQLMGPILALARRPCPSSGETSRTHAHTC